MCLGGVLRSFVGLVSVLVSQDQQYNQHRWLLPEVNEIKKRSNLKDWSCFLNLMNLLEFIKSVFMVPRAGLGTIWNAEFQHIEFVVIIFLFTKACDPVCDPKVAVTYVKIKWVNEVRHIANPLLYDC